MDRIRVTAWWCDPRLEDGIPIDDVDIALYDVTSGAAAMQFSLDAYDNKERVWSDDIDGERSSRFDYTAAT